MSGWRGAYLFFGVGGLYRRSKMIERSRLLFFLLLSVKPPKKGAKCTRHLCAGLDQSGQRCQM